MPTWIVMYNGQGLVSTALGLLVYFLVYGLQLGFLEIGLIDKTPFSENHLDIGVIFGAATALWHDFQPRAHRHRKVVRKLFTPISGGHVFFIPIWVWATLFFLHGASILIGFIGFEDVYHQFNDSIVIWGFPCIVILGCVYAYGLRLEVVPDMSLAGYYDDCQIVNIRNDELERYPLYRLKFVRSTYKLGEIVDKEEVDQLIELPPLNQLGYVYEIKRIGDVDLDSGRQADLFVELLYNAEGS